jgi:hypothetical protein
VPLDDPTAAKPEIAREIMTDFPVLPRCNYIAGLSAGGAAAAIMGSTYPGSPALVRFLEEPGQDHYHVPDHTVVGLVLYPEPTEERLASVTRE